MNPVLVLTHNCLELTKKCVESIHLQSLTTEILAIDNGSTDGTLTWLTRSGSPRYIASPSNMGVSKGWNIGLDYWLNLKEAQHVLVVNNDTILPPWFYQQLLGRVHRGAEFVSGVSVDTHEQIRYREHDKPLYDHPDFSAFLITRACWVKVGPFDEDMKHYASDCDYHVRAHRLGIQLWNAGVHFYHERSSTLKNASPEDRAEIEHQANEDRAAFRRKYGTIPGEEAYADLFK